MSRLRIVMIALAMVALIGAGMTLAAGVARASTSITINLNPLNNSGQSGKAVLTDLGNGQTKVELTLTGEPDGANEPVHIHNGSCANLGSVKYPLTNVMTGTSTTTVSATLASLQTGNFAINGHKSAAEISVYVFCGDIPAASTTAAPATLPTTGGVLSAWWLGVLFLGLVALGAGLVVRRLPSR